jgi:hypothetical protein
VGDERTKTAGQRELPMFVKTRQIEFNEPLRWRSPLLLEDELIRPDPVALAT